MPRYEYKVIPAPTKGQKAKGVKTPEARFALAVQTALNEMGAEGWDYVRADLLPSEERSGLTGSTQTWRNLLVFRRALPDPAEDFAARTMDLPAPVHADPDIAAPRLGGAVRRLTEEDMPGIADPGRGPEEDGTADRGAEDEGPEQDGPEQDSAAAAAPQAAGDASSRDDGPRGAGEKGDDNRGAGAKSVVKPLRFRARRDDAGNPEAPPVKD